MTTTKLLKTTLALFLLALLAACNSEELDSLNYTTSDAEEIFLTENTSVASYSVSRRGGKCFTLIFPVLINFPDGTQESYQENTEIKTALKTWKEANPDAEERPLLVYPLDIEYKDGTTATVESREQMQDLKDDCKRKKRKRGHDKCFTLVFPVTLEFPDGETQELNDKKELKTSIRTWKRANQDSEERPGLVFPVEVKLKDETTQTINSEEEMKALKEDC